jgi:hypothetical protein
MTPIVARFAIAIGGSMEASIVLKATLVLGLTLAAIRLAPRARASIRHIVLAAAFCVLLTLPFVAVLLPPVVINIPVSTISDSTIPLVMLEPSPAVGYLANTNGQSPATARARPSASWNTTGIRGRIRDKEPGRLPWLPEGADDLWG